MEPNSSSSHSKSLLNRADKLGSMLSSLCAVHCLCMPMLLSVLPVLGLSFLATHTFERVACVTMTLFATACLWAGCRTHRRWGLFILLILGAGLMLRVQFGAAEEDKTHIGWTEAVVMVIGGSLIAVSHVLNRKLRARCHCRECEAQEIPHA